MTRHPDKPTPTELGVIVSFGALWFAIGFLCALVIGPVMGVGG